MQNRRKYIWLVGIVIVAMLAVVISLPPVWSRIDYRSRELYRTIKYWIQPPNEAVFVPSTRNNNAVDTPVSASFTVAAPTPLPTTGPTATPGQFSLEATFTPTPTLTSTPTPTAVPLPSSVLLKGFTAERQFFNNCGPATLAVYLSYYNWGKDQLAVSGVLRPNWTDVNVMPYELVDFVNQNTDQRALWRNGGDLQTIKVLLNAGFPVMFEKTFEPFSLRKEGWMGHYNLAVGYDEKRQSLTVQDTYLMSYPPWGGGEIPPEKWKNFIGFDFFYTNLEQEWRAFNYVFIVVYPPEKEQEVLNALGPLADEKEANRIAYERADQETATLTDVRDKFFAWFNAGTSLVAMQDYKKAAAAYDTAFTIYPDIPYERRPYRILWYETGPYEAYYYSERYQDVINLATQTLTNMADPVLEESYYWRGLSYYKLGDKAKAVQDLRTSLKYHAGYAPSIDMLKQLGETP